MNKKISIEKYLSLNNILIGLSILLACFYIFEAKTFFVLFLLILSIVIIKHPEMGFAAWLLAYGLYYTIEGVFGIKPHFFLVPIIVYSVIILISRGVKWQDVPKDVFAFCISMSFFGLLSLIFSRDFNNSIIPFGVLITDLSILISIIIFCKKNPKMLKLMNQALIYAVIIAILSTISVDGLAGIGRIRLGGNVRKMANTVSPAIIVLFCEFLYISAKKKSYLFYQLSKKSIFILLILNIFILLTTISRGAYLAVGVSLVTTVLISFLWEPKSVATKKNVIYFSILLAIIVVIVPFINSTIAGGSMSRASLDMWADNPRWQIWLGAFNQLKPYELITGSGLGTYRQLELLTGHNYYAHSVYADTLVTMGIPAFITLIIFLMYIIVRVVKSKCHYCYSLTLLTCILYLTHGSVTGSMEFWTLIGMSYASTYIFTNE